MTMTHDEMIPFLTGYYRTRHAVNIEGPPGSGKSEMITQVAEALSRNHARFGLVTYIASGLDPSEIRGVPIPTKDADGTVGLRFTEPMIWPKKINVEVFDGGESIGIGKQLAGDIPLPEHGILFIDEESQADLDVKKVLAQLTLDRKLGEHILPTGWVVWSAGNRLSDKSGATRTPAMLQNRRMTLEVNQTYDSWEKWAFKNHIHPLLIGFAKAHPDLVFIDKVPNEPGAFCTSRSLVLLGETLINMKGPDDSPLDLPDDHIAATAVTGWIGEAVAPAFMSYIRLAHDLPDIEEVFDDPIGTMIPDRLDARFVMATALAAHVSDKNHPAATARMRASMVYMDRMDVELCVMFVRGVINRDPAALRVAEFSQWVGRNSDLIVAANG